MPRPIVLAAGGTGGHVFPAEALAGELEARGVPFTLVTDSRGRQWQGALSRRPIHYIHSASPTGSLRAPLAGAVLARPRPVRRLARARPHRSRRRGRLRRLCLGADHDRRPPAPACRRWCTSRTPCWAGPTAGAGRRVAGRDAPSPRTRFVGDERARLVGNPVREPVRRLARPPYRAPGAGARDRSAGVRRQPGCARPSRGRSRGDRCRCRRRCARGCASCSSAGRRIWSASARIYLQADIVAELAPFFADLPQRLAARASGDRPLRRLDRGRARRRRPAVDPGAAIPTRPTITRPPTPAPSRPAAPAS